MAIAVLPKLNRALLVLHSPVDKVVGIDNAAQIYQAARHPKSFISLDTADHMLGRPADAAYAGSVIAEWAARYIDIRKKPVRPVPVRRTPRGHPYWQVVATRPIVVGRGPSPGCRRAG
jgi:hypothetical protein